MTGKVEKPKPRYESEFAKQGEIKTTDPAGFDSPTGHEDHLGLAEARRIAGSEINKPIGAQPRSEVTARHDEGSGANEKKDGLTNTEEAFA